MSGEKIDKLSNVATQNRNDVYMQAGIVDQININQQSNMTLSSYSVLTQSCSTVKINNV